MDPRVAARAAGLAALLAGCGGVTWRNADLQVDVAGAEWTDEDVVRVCVEGVGQREEAAGRGLVAFPGLPADGPMRITVSILGHEGVAGPVELDADVPYARVAWEGCDGCEPCAAEGEPAAADAPDRLLAVRLE